MPVGLPRFEDRNNTPLLLPTSFFEVQTEPILTKCLLSLVEQLAPQFHSFRIFAVWISHDSHSTLRKLEPIPEKCPYTWILGSLLDARMFKNFSASRDLIWLCIHNVGYIASPGLAQPLHFFDAISILALHSEPCGLLLSCPQIFRKFQFCPPNRQDVFCMALSSRSCFCIQRHSRLSEKKCIICTFTPALSEVAFAGVFAERRGAGGGISTSAGETSVKLEDPLVNTSVNG